MLFSEDIILENEKVRLEPLNYTKHKDALHKYAIEEPTIWKYSLVSPGGSAEAMDAYIAYAIKQREQEAAYTFIIIDKCNDTVAGSTRFYDVSIEHKAITIGYTWLGEKHRATGINRNCKLLLLEYAFEKLQLERVEFRADINNTRSINAMKAIGCVEEGVLRSHATINDTERRTSIILSILKEEWFSNTKTLLLSKIKH